MSDVFINNMTRELQTALDERDQLAAFPRLNPTPVLEVDYEGKITYSNPAVSQLFPELELMQLSHPFLLNVRYFLERPDKDLPQTMIASSSCSFNSFAKEKALTIRPNDS